MSLNVSVKQKEPGVFTVFCSGSLDTNTYSILENEVNQILDSSTKVIIFNMEGGTYISSMGIGVILKTKQAIEKNKGSVILTNLAPQVKLAFDIIKALPNQTIFTSIEEVDAYLEAIQKKEIDKRKSSL